jgi:ElaB/YqjD/DUF883 family membrane-anchored ribosome-binding protein
MDEGAGLMNDRRNFSDTGTPRGRPLNQESPEEIRADIEETRNDMSDTIDDLQYRLDPNRLKAQAKTAARDATFGRAEDMMNTAEQRTQEAGTSLMNTLKQNPVPVAMIALGAGWLMMSSHDQDPDSLNHSTYYTRSQRTASDYAPRYSTSRSADRSQSMADQATERAGHAANQAQQQMHEYVGQAHRMTDQAQGSLTGFVHDNPLAAAAVALGVGFAVGFAVPETQKEDELLGEAHMKAMNRARSMADSAVDKAVDSNTVDRKVDEMTHTAANKAKDAVHQATDR